MQNHFTGCLLGVAIGDALGAPVEFLNAEEIKQRHGRVTEYLGGGWLNLKPGEYSDDTALTPLKYISWRKKMSYKVASENSNKHII